MITKKIHYIIDESIEDKSFKKNLLKNKTNYNLKDSDAIVVVGGDGFMLEVLKKFYKYSVALKNCSTHRNARKKHAIFSRCKNQISLF